MSDLISRKRIEFELCESNMPKKYRDFCRRVINSESLSPTIDAEPARHGHWDEWDDTMFNTVYRCSVCGEDFVLIDGTPSDNLYNYCPNCGAKMEEVSE